MKLKEYLKSVKKSNNLNSAEIKVFGLTDMSSGWANRYADFEITDVMLKEVFNRYSVKSGKKKSLAKLSQVIKSFEVRDNKLLYLMKNSYGDLKIGISVDPIKRARQLTTGSGSTVMCLAAWEVEESARAVEATLHRVFHKYRKEGEWFAPRSFSAEDLEKKIPCQFNKVYTNDTAFIGVESEEYQFLHIKHETEKATLFRINSVDVWVPKSKILSLNKEQHIVRVPIGMISEKLQMLA